MEVVYPCCAGIDIHKLFMVVCVIIDRLNGRPPEYHKRKFVTHSEGIRELIAWLQELGVTDVGLESTGVYWKPVWNALEGKFRLHLCNPQHVRVIPGSKTDFRDGRRIAELLYHGKLPKSFIPPKWQRELRTLTRMRTQFMNDRTRLVNRVLKVLEDGQIKLDAVASDSFGVSGRLILKSLAEGNTDAAALAKKAVGRLKRKEEELRQALDGNFTEHHRFLLQQLLKLIEAQDDAIAKLDAEIRTYLKPYEQLVERLDEVPGVDRVAVGTILAEIGPDMMPWEDARKLASWSCLCPGNHESGGKRLSGRTRRGNRWLRRCLCQTAWAATRKKDSYFKAQYRRLAGRRGKQRALLAVAHTQITVFYHLIATPGLRFRDLGEDYFDKRDALHTARNLVKRLGKLGYEVTLTPKAA